MQPLNANFPMVVRLSGKVISVSLFRVTISVLWVSIPLSCQYVASSSVNDGGTMRYLRFVQPLNASLSIEVRLSKVRWVSPVQPANAYSLMVVRLVVAGKEMEGSPMQPANTSSPMVVRLSGRSTAISFSNKQNALSSIASIPSGMVMRVTLSLYGSTMFCVMTLVSSEKVKWVLSIIACGIQCSCFLSW